MDNTASKAEVKQFHQIPLNQIRLSGKILSGRKYEKKYYTAIVSPALDEYSSPSRFEVRSNNPLGDRDEVINVLCVASGRARSFTFKDRETGDTKTGYNYDVYFEVIE